MLGDYQIEYKERFSVMGTHTVIVSLDGRHGWIGFVDGAKELYGEQ